MDIVLGDGEHLIVHTRTGRAAAEVIDLEALNDRGAVIGSYSTGTGDVAVGIEDTAAVDGDITKTVTTQGVYLVSDINNQNDTSRWVETVINISGNKYKVEYMESGE